MEKLLSLFGQIIEIVSSSAGVTLPYSSSGTIAAKDPGQLGSELRKQPGVTTVPGTPVGNGPCY